MRTASGKTYVRRFARYRTEFPLMVAVLGKEGSIHLHGRCFEIAEGGIGAVISGALAAGEMVSLEFSIPTASTPVLLRAVVRYRLGFLHGFEFIGIASEHRQQIRAFCQGLLPA
jgi:hypothetical protein